MARPHLHRRTSRPHSLDIVVLKTCRKIPHIVLAAAIIGAAVTTTYAYGLLAQLIDDAGVDW